MVVNGHLPGLPPNGENATRRLSDEDGHRFRGDPQTLPVIKLSDLSDAHRRQVVAGLRELVQRTCLDMVQHLVEKRKTISDVIDVVKQQTNLTYFDLNSTARDELMADDNGSPNAPRDGFATEEAGDVLTAAFDDEKDGGMTVSDSFETVVAGDNNIRQKVTPPVPAENSAVSIPRTSPPRVSATNSPSTTAEPVCFAELEATQQTVVPSTNYAPGIDGVRSRSSQKLVDSVTADVTPSSIPDLLCSEINPAPQSHIPQCHESPPSQMSQAWATATDALQTSSSANLSQHSQTGITYKRLRGTLGHCSRRGGSVHRRWKKKSGTIVTHCLALSAQDLIDYPGQPPLLRDSRFEALGNELRLISMSDCADMSDDDVMPNGDADHQRIALRAASRPPSDTFASRALPFDASKDTPQTTTDTVFADVDKQPEAVSPVEITTALHADLPTDSVLMRTLQRRYSLTLTDAARSQLDSDDEAEVTRNKYRYSAAILRYSEGSALVHCRTMRLIEQYFPDFNVSAMLGKCGSCSQLGLSRLWSKSGRFCSSQCTKRFARNCQTQQNQQHREVIEHPMANKDAASSSDSIHNNNNTAVIHKPNSRSRNESRMPSSSRHNDEDETGLDAKQRRPANHFCRNYAVHSNQEKPRRPTATVSTATNGIAAAQPHSATSSSRRRGLAQEASMPMPMPNGNAPIASGASAAAALPGFPINRRILWSLEHKNAKEWTHEEVAQFVAGSSVNPICADIPRQFISDSVDGEALLMMNFENLVRDMHIPVGPAVKISKAIELLQAAEGRIDMRNLPQLHV